MKSKFFSFGAVALFVFVSFGAAFGQKFTGAVGTAKFEMTIERDGGSLKGDYYYRKSGSANSLSLKGSIAADGSFTMQESDAAGKKTGVFKGKWREDANDSGASLDGQWLKPGETGEGQFFYASEQMINFQSVKLTTREINEAIKPKKATLSAEYPELSGSPNAAKFNALAKAAVMRSLAGFRKDMASLTAADIKNIGPDMGNYIEVGYSIEFADDDLISVNFGESTFEGGAHPNHGTFTMTYDLKAGRELKLADLFKPGAKYLAKIAEYSLRDLQARKDPDSGDNMGIAHDEWADGAKPTADNYANWNVTKKGLLITFDAYQVAAYAYGPQTVIVPYATLKTIANPNGALAKSK